MPRLLVQGKEYPSIVLARKGWVFEFICGTPMIIILAVIARRMIEVRVASPVPTALVACHQVSRKMDVRQSSVLVEIQVRSLHGDKHVRGPVDVRHRVAVRLYGLWQEHPRLAIPAEEV